MVEAFSVEQFCRSHSISRSLFYLLENQGIGPKTFKAGRRTLIGKEAAAEWRQRMERKSAENQQAVA